MGLPHRGIVEPVRPHQNFRLVAPVGEMPLVELGEASAGPGLDMDAVGDGMDPVAGEKLARDFRVPLGDAVDVAAEVQRQPGHVEVLPAGDCPERSDIDDAFQLSFDHIVRKAVVAGLDRSMGSKYAVLPCDLRIVAGMLGGVAVQVAVAVQHFQCQQGRVPLVHVVGLDLEAERPQQADAADPEHDFLLEPVSVIAAVQPIGHFSFIASVLLDVGVQHQ